MPKKSKYEFIKDFPVKKLKPYDRNPRKNEQAVSAMVKSIKEFGFVSPIIIDSRSRICAGHTRLKAAISLGLKTVPVLKVFSLTGNRFEGYNIADNRIGEIAEWDEAELAAIPKELLVDDFNMDALGFDDAELAEYLAEEGDRGKTDPDEVPEPPKKPVCQTGDLWQLGNHRLLCGDATKEADVARLMDGQKADMVFTDPPYAVSYGHDQENLQKISGGKFSKTRKRTKIENDDMTAAECSDKCWRPSFRNMYLNASDHCTFYMTMCQGGDQMMMMMMMAENWQIKHELIWVKNAPVFSMGRLDYDYQHEPILYGWKKKHIWYGKGQFLKSIWQIPKPTKSDLHPTMKPIALIVNAVLNSSKTKDIVLDLFLGSGSTLIACEQTGRICYGMEIDPLYCDVIIKRWEDFTGKKAEKLK